MLVSITRRMKNILTDLGLMRLDEPTSLQFLEDGIEDLTREIARMRGIAEKMREPREEE